MKVLGVLSPFLQEGAKQSLRQRLKVLPLKEEPMAVHESIDGVVVRVWDEGENDRYLSVLTAEKGRITNLS